MVEVVHFFFNKGMFAAIIKIKYGKIDKRKMK